MKESPLAIGLFLLILIAGLLFYGYKSFILTEGAIQRIERGIYESRVK